MRGHENADHVGRLGKYHTPGHFGERLLHRTHFLGQTAHHLRQTTPDEDRLGIHRAFD